MENPVQKNFAKFSGKYLCLSVSFDKVQDLRFATLLKRDFDTVVFMQMLPNFRNTFFKEHLQATALSIVLTFVYACISFSLF